MSLLQYTSLFQVPNCDHLTIVEIVHNSPYEKLSVGVQSLAINALESDIHYYLKPYVLPPISSMSRHKTRTSTHHPQAATWTWVPFITKFTTKTTLPSLGIEPIDMSCTQTSKNKVAHCIMALPLMPSSNKQQLKEGNVQWTSQKMNSCFAVNLSEWTFFKIWDQMRITSFHTVSLTGKANKVPSTSSKNSEIGLLKTSSNKLPHPTKTLTKQIQIDWQ